MSEIQEMILRAYDQINEGTKRVDYITKNDIKVTAYKIPPNVIRIDIKRKTR